MRRNSERPVAIVTGASRRLGKAIALRMAKEGYDLSLGARSERPLRDLQQQLANEGATSLVTTVDLTDCEDREKFVRRTLEEMGRVDVLINNAAVSSLVRFSDTNWNDLGYQLHLNLEAPMHLAHLALGDMVERASGRIVNISSVPSMMAVPGLVLDGTAKSALRYFTKALTKELEGTGVSVSAVIPGDNPGTDTTKSLEARWGVGLKGVAAKGIRSPASVANDVMDVMERDGAEKVSARGGSVLRRFPSLGERMTKPVFSPVVEAAAKHDHRKVTDPSVEGLVA